MGRFVYRIDGGCGFPRAFRTVNTACTHDLVPRFVLPDGSGSGSSSPGPHQTLETPLTRLPFILAALFAMLPLAQPVLAQDQSRVGFERGNDNAAINGTVVGDGYIDYLLGAKKGQTMAVSLMPGESNGNGSVYFNILPPGSTGEAIYNGSIDGLDATGIVLPKDGDYVIRVYQMGNDADSGKTTAFMISVGIM